MGNLSPEHKIFIERAVIVKNAENFKKSHSGLCPITLCLYIFMHIPPMIFESTLNFLQFDIYSNMFIFEKLDFSAFLTSGSISGHSKIGLRETLKRVPK